MKQIARFAAGESIVRYEPAPPMAGTTGEIEALSMWAGQGVALATKSQAFTDYTAEDYALVTGVNLAGGIISRRPNQRRSQVRTSSPPSGLQERDNER